MDQDEVVLYVLLPSIVAGPFVLSCIFGCISGCISGCRDFRREAEERNAVELARALAAAAAAPVVKKELGHFPYSAAAEGGGTAARLECAICLEAFVRGATCSEVPACRHLFHRDCIELWMRSKSAVGCPLCRAKIVPGSEPPSAAEDMV